MRKKSYLDRKWKSLEKRGIKRPKTHEEARRRLKEAHHAH